MQKLILKSGAVLMLGLLCQASLAEQQICNPQLRATAPTARFIDNGDGTVKDASTGLIWSRCDLGQQWSSEEATCLGEAEELSWTDALNAVSQQNDSPERYAGIWDWRIPNIKELMSIIEWSCTNPAINTQVFMIDSDPKATLKYWSSTPAFNPLQDEQGVWSFNFEVPERQGPTSLTPNVSTDPQYPDEPPEKLKVRLVRDAPVP